MYIILESTLLPCIFSFEIFFKILNNNLNKLKFNIFIVLHFQLFKLVNSFLIQK